MMVDIALIDNYRYPVKGVEQVETRRNPEVISSDLFEQIIQNGDHAATRLCLPKNMNGD